MKEVGVQIFVTGEQSDPEAGRKQYAPISLSADGRKHNKLLSRKIYFKYILEIYNKNVDLYQN
jgi:hypothetical protein